MIDWEDCGLRRPSYIRIDQKLELAFEDLLRETPIGTLSTLYIDIIAKALGSL